MQILPNGKMEFSDVFDLNYELFNELELTVMPDGSLVDTTRNTIMFFDSNKIIAATKPNDVKYATDGQIQFDPIGNIKLVNMIFGWWLTKKGESGFSIMSFFPEETIDKNTGVKYTSMTLKIDVASSIQSKKYHNKCLSFLDLIFLVEGDPVDLSNFDVIEDEKARRK